MPTAKEISKTIHSHTREMLDELLGDSTYSKVNGAPVPRNTEVS